MRQIGFTLFIAAWSAAVAVALLYPGTGPGGRLIARAEIEKFHRDVAQGRYVGREKDKAEDRKSVV